MLNFSSALASADLLNSKKCPAPSCLRCSYGCDAIQNLCKKATVAKLPLYCYIRPKCVQTSGSSHAWWSLMLDVQGHIIAVQQVLLHNDHCNLCRSFQFPNLLECAVEFVVEVEESGKSLIVYFPCYESHGVYFPFFFASISILEPHQ